MECVNNNQSLFDIILLMNYNTNWVSNVLFSKWMRKMFRHKVCRDGDMKNVSLLIIHTECRDMGSNRVTESGRKSQWDTLSPLGLWPTLVPIDLDNRQGNEIGFNGGLSEETNVLSNSPSCHLTLSDADEQFQPSEYPGVRKFLYGIKFF